MAEEKTKEPEGVGQEIIDAGGEVKFEPVKLGIRLWNR